MMGWIILHISQVSIRLPPAQLYTFKHSILNILMLDPRWTSVLTNFLNFKEEIGIVFLSPTHAEVWKGTENKCPYFKNYQEQSVVIAHTHPQSPERPQSPPSPTDLLNSISGHNKHIVVATEGFWVYEPTASLKEEWMTLDEDTRQKLLEIIVHNAYGLIATFLGGAFVENFSDGVSRQKIELEQFCERMRSLVPRKKIGQPELGFNINLQQELVLDGTFDEERKLFGYEWDLDVNISKLDARINETEGGNCVTSDGSFVAF